MNSLWDWDWRRAWGLRLRTASISYDLGMKHRPLVWGGRAARPCFLGDGQMGLSHLPGTLQGDPRCHFLSTPSCALGKLLGHFSTSSWIRLRIAKESHSPLPIYLPLCLSHPRTVLWRLQGKALPLILWRVIITLTHICEGFSCSFSSSIHKLVIVWRSRK